MDKELKKLKKIVKFMKNEGVLTYKTSEMELHLASSALFPVKEEPQSQSTLEESFPKFSDEDALFWSSAGLPDEVQQ